MGAADRAARRRRVRRRPRGRGVVSRRGLRLNPLSRFTGRVHRQTGIDTAALPPDRPAPTGARYHRPGEPWPLYASLEPETAWAEWAAGTRGAVDPDLERRRLWRVGVRDLAVVDLRRPGVVAELGIDLATLTGPRSRAHGLARRARELGAEGMVVPSAARPGEWNLVVFPAGFDRLRIEGSRAMHPRPPGRVGQGASRRRISSG